MNGRAKAPALRCGRLARLLLALALVVACRAETLTVATYNVENYMLADRMADGAYRRNYPKPEAEKTALRAVIAGLNADVLVMQEMGGIDFLRELRRDLAAQGIKFPYAEILDADDKDRRLTVLSRRPFTTVRRHADLTFNYLGGVEKVKRGLLELHVATDAGDVAIFAVHLKSRFTDRADDPDSATRRAGEAVAVRDRILRIFPDPAKARFLILGDFNDSRSSRPVRAMLSRGATAIAACLPATDSRGEVWSHFWRKADEYSRIDQILASPGLLPMVREGKASICDAPAAAVASDHRPLVVMLDLKK